MKWAPAFGLFVYRAAVILTLLLIAVGSLDRHVRVRAIPDKERQTVCYVTDRGGISCVADGRRL